MQPQIIVAGHICLDVIPDLNNISEEFNTIFKPGKLINIGPANTSTGGPVSNTGLALHRLGIPTGLMGKVANDSFGDVIIKTISSYDPELAKEMIVMDGVHTSYTLVFNPKGVDRMFLHYPGANNSFKNADVDFSNVEGSKIFHFGYPPLMRLMYQKNGKELVELMKRAKKYDLITSLDMAYPDPKSEAGQINWIEFLENVLPYIDIFLPSLDEIAFMLKYENDLHSRISDIAKTLLNMGAGIVGLKLGDSGFYLRTSSNKGRLTFLRKCGYKEIETWTNQELMSTCFKVKVVGTTGAGDSTIAGFLAALIKKLAVTDVINSAVAVGACNVEALDAVEGIPGWESVQSRISTGWEKHRLKMNLDDWVHLEEKKVWKGPDDNRV
jgi:sugar/nucleoside kinase (ribokinase family)